MRRVKSDRERLVEARHVTVKALEALRVERRERMADTSALVRRGVIEALRREADRLEAEL